MERQLPKNVRQIGNVSDSSKIYVEDYVDTFFNQLCEKAEQEMIGAFLVGETVREEEQDYIFIYGAIQMKDLEMKGKDFVIDEGAWKNACETCKEYFGSSEILGWFITGGEQPLEVNHNINKIHQKYFPREQSIFITKDARDKEEKFYIYKYRNMMECNGHYVYYEKNLEMQNYMISTRKRTGFTPSELIEDRVTKNFRSIIREKTEKNEQKTQSRFVYALSTFLVLVVLVIGVTVLGNYDRMKKVQDSLNEVSENERKEENDTEEAVETLGGIVEAEDAENEEPKTEDAETQDTENQGTETKGTEIQGAETEDTDTETAKDGNTQVSNENANTGEAENEGETPEEVERQETASKIYSEIYTVEEGDTLETISRKTYGDISHVEEICELNDLEDGNFIFVGQKLLLP